MANVPIVYRKHRDQVNGYFKEGYFYIPLLLLLLAAAMAAAAAANAIFSGAKFAESLCLRSDEDSNPEPELGVRAVAADGIGPWMGRIGDTKPNCDGAEKAAPKLNADAFFSLLLLRCSLLRILLIFGAGMSGKEILNVS